MLGSTGTKKLKFRKKNGPIVSFIFSKSSNSLVFLLASLRNRYFNTITHEPIKILLIGQQ